MVVVTGFNIYHQSRTQKLPSTYESLKTVIAVKGEQNGWNVCGFSDSCQCITIFDGKTDTFDTCLQSVRGNFKNTAAIRRYMQVDDASSKVFAIVLEPYTPKGIHTYELHMSTQRVRHGYGRANVRYVKPTNNTDHGAMASFFKPSTVPGFMLV